jgi:hypothetical protein
MLPMTPVRLQLGALLAADTTTLAPATANKVALYNTPTAINENLVPGSLSLATFTGSSPISGTAGAQGVGTDPATGDQVVTILAPAGGWRFVCTAAPVTPETIYGFALLDHTLAATLLAIAALPTPTTIVNVGDEIDLGSIPLTFVLQPIS